MAINPKADALLRVFNPSTKSQESLLSFLTSAKRQAISSYNIQDVMINIDKLYARETDRTNENRQAKLANKVGDSSKFQNITVPIIATQTESAVTYQTSVFLTGQPIFGVVSSNEFIDEAIQLESIIDSQSIRGGWARQLMLAFRDGYKYNMGAVEAKWNRELKRPTESQTSDSIEKDTIISWEGNTLKRLDMYNTFWDVRFPITEVSDKGEFAGYTELITKLELKNLVSIEPNFITSNIKSAFESPIGNVSSIGNQTSAMPGDYVIPKISDTQMISPNAADGMDWDVFAGISPVGGDNKIRYKQAYTKTILYARILPSDFSLSVPSPNTPQIWRFVWINGTVLVVAEPVKTYKDKLPILFIQPNEDGLSYQTKSLAQNAEEFQSVASALMNSTIHARRRAVSDRLIYDPSRIDAKHINSDNPSARIPVRPNAYGKPLNEAVYAFPFRDDQAGIISGEITSLVQMANELAGQNRATQGQFVKGNKTQKEYDSVISNARGKDQMTAILLETQLFTPLKEMLKYNILLYQTPTTVYNRALKDYVKIKPIDIQRASTEFKVSDGLIPSEKLLSGEILTTAFQALSSSQALNGEYEMGKLFSYLMKTQGADIEQFEKSTQQKQFEQAIAQWQNAIAQISEGLKKLPPNSDLSKIQFPPQPTPEQFGIDPNSPQISNGALERKEQANSIIDRTIAKLNSTNQGDE
jgi:hypothetical protein